MSPGSNVGTAEEILYGQTGCRQSNSVLARRPWVPEDGIDLDQLNLDSRWHDGDSAIGFWSGADTWAVRMPQSQHYWKDAQEYDPEAAKAAKQKVLAETVAIAQALEAYTPSGVAIEPVLFPLRSLTANDHGSVYATPIADLGKWERGYDQLLRVDRHQLAAVEQELGDEVVWRYFRMSIDRVMVQKLISLDDQGKLSGQVDIEPYISP